MKTRVISGIVGTIVAIVAVLKFYTPFFDIAAFAIYAIAVFEICRVFKEGNSKLVNASLTVLGALILFGTRYNIGIMFS